MREMAVHSLVPGLYHEHEPVFAKDSELCYFACGDVIVVASAKSGAVSKERLEVGSPITAFTATHEGLVVATADAKIRFYPINEKNPLPSANEAQELKFGNDNETPFTNLVCCRITNKVIAYQHGEEVVFEIDVNSDSDIVKNTWKISINKENVTKESFEKKTILDVSAAFVTIGMNGESGFHIIRRLNGEGRSWQHVRPITAISIDPEEKFVTIGDIKGAIYTCYVLKNAAKKNKRVKTQQDGGAKNFEKKHHFEKSNILSGDWETIPLSGMRHWHAQKIGGLRVMQNFILSGGEESVLVLWQVELNTKQFLPRLGRSGIAHLKESPNNQYIAVSIKDNSVVFVNLHAGNQIRRLEGLEIVANVTKPQIELMSESTLALHTGNNCIQFCNIEEDSLKVDFSVAVHERNQNSVTVAPIKVGDKASKNVGVERQWNMQHFCFAGEDWMCTAEEKLKGQDSFGLNGGYVLKWWQKVKEDPENSDSKTFEKKSTKRPGQWEQESCVYDAHSDSVTSLLGHGGAREEDSFFITTSKDGHVKKWELASMVPESVSTPNIDESKLPKQWQTTGLQIYKDNAPIDCACLSKDGSVVAIASGTQIMLWSTSNLNTISGTKIYTHSIPGLKTTTSCKSTKDTKEPAYRILGKKEASEKTYTKEERLEMLKRIATKRVEKLQFVNIGERKALFSLGSGALNLWDLGSNEKVFSIAESPDMKIENMIWEAKQLVLLIRKSTGEQEIQVWRRSEDCVLEQVETMDVAKVGVSGYVYSSSGILALARTSFLKIDTEVSIATKNAISLSKASSAKKATPSAHDKTENFYQRLFAGRETSTEQVGTLAEFLQWYHSKQYFRSMGCDVGDRIMSKQAQQQIVDSIIMKGTPSHLLPSASQIFDAYMDKTLRRVKPAQKINRRQSDFLAQLDSTNYDFDQDDAQEQVVILPLEAFPVTI